MGKSFCIEHVGIMVREPLAMAQWYEEVLGFRMAASSKNGEAEGAFLFDGNARTLVEFGRIPGVTALSEKTDNPAQLHIALESSDPDADAEYLVEHGATYLEECPMPNADDKILLLEDPWGNTLQLVKRTPAISLPGLK